MAGLIDLENFISPENLELLRSNLVKPTRGRDRIYFKRRLQEAIGTRHIRILQRRTAHDG